MTIHDYENGFTDTLETMITNAVDWKFSYSTGELYKNIPLSVIEMLATVNETVKRFITESLEESGVFVYSGNKYNLHKENGLYSLYTIFFKGKA